MWLEEWLAEWLARGRRRSRGAQGRRGPRRRMTPGSDSAGAVPRQHVARAPLPWGVAMRLVWRDGPSRRGDRTLRPLRRGTAARIGSTVLQTWRSARRRQPRRALRAQQALPMGFDGNRGAGADRRLQRRRQRRLQLRELAAVAVAPAQPRRLRQQGSISSRRREPPLPSPLRELRRLADLGSRLRRRRLLSLQPPPQGLVALRQQPALMYASLPGWAGCEWWERGGALVSAVRLRENRCQRPHRASSRTLSTDSRGCRVRTTPIVTP
jgi:hypothetical protein